MSNFPKGPWEWYGNRHGVYLATRHGGRKWVMAFSRFGMHGAQPTFPDGGLMIPASELVKFEVGDGEATGFKEGEADESVYRLDVKCIDHPVARAMAEIPTMLAALQAHAAYASCEATGRGSLPQRMAIYAHAQRLTSQALAAAAGEDVPAYAGSDEVERLVGEALEGERGK